MSESDQTCGRCGAPLGNSLRGGVCAACRLEALLPLEGEFAHSVSYDALTADTAAVQHFGPYELLEEIGRGGMGVIYKARQPGLDRIVALKMLLAGEFADAKARERLLREAKIAARLTHPGIVTIHEVGEHQGRPYFAMEYVPGRNLAQHCRDGLLPVATAVRYVEQLARAVHYAHQHGVIHRDLKPANILISPDDEPKLTDFGLTKSLVDPTQTIESAGSPNFMAPEQADSTLGTTGTPTDIFGLGAILYYLLTGRPPAVGETLSETLRNVVTGEPVAPRQLRPALPRDLETITLKCLEKEPARRYGSAQEVAEELARWQRHEPILARPASGPERLAKWVRRRPVVAALSTACALVLVLGLAATTWQWQRAETQAEEAARSNYAATLNTIRQRLDDGDYLAARRQLFALPERFRGWEWGRLLNLAHREILAAPVLTHGWSGPMEMVPTPPSSLGHVLSPDYRWAACWGSGRFEVLNLTNQSSVFRLGSGDHRVTDAAFNASGDRLATAGPGPGFSLWKSGEWRVLRQWATNQSTPLAVRFSPDGSRVTTADGSKRVQVFDTGSGVELGTFEGAAGAYVGARFDPTGTRLIGIEQLDGDVKRYTIWNVSTGTVESEVPRVATGIRSVELSDDARHYATVDDHGVASVWRVGDDLRSLFSTPPGGKSVHWAMVSPDRSRLVTLRGWPSQAEFWNLENGESLPATGLNIRAMNVGSDGRTLISCSDALVHVWDWESGKPVETLGVVDVPIWPRLDVSPDGRSVSALIGYRPIPTTLHVWPLRSREVRLSPPNTAFRSALAPDGETVALAHLDSRISLWNARTMERLGWLNGHFRQVNDLAWTSDGHTLFSGGGDHTVRRWNVAERRLEATWTNLTRGVWTLSTTPDGRRVAAADLSGRVMVWEGLTGAVVRSWDVPVETELLPVQQVRLSPSGRDLAITGFSSAGVWSVDSGRLVKSFNSQPMGKTFDPVSAEYSRDGRRLATSDRSGRLRIWDTRTWDLVVATEASVGAPDLTFSQDGRRLFLTTSQVLAPSPGQTMVEVRDGQSGVLLLELGRLSGWGTRIAYDDRNLRLLHTIVDEGRPTRGTELLDALPWRDQDIPGERSEMLEERVTRYARTRLWQGLRTPLTPLPDAGPPETEPRGNWEPRNPATPSSCVDLTASYNGHLETGWTPDGLLFGFGDDLSALPRGMVRLDGMTWDIRGVITTGQPQRTPLLPWRVGSSITGIPIKGRLRRLSFLHAAARSQTATGVVGRYRLHYANGATADLPLELGEDIGEWWSNHPLSSCRKGALAWEGRSQAAARQGAKVRLFHRVWDNPIPDQELVSLDVVGESPDATCFLVAINVEP